MSICNLLGRKFAAVCQKIRPTTFCPLEFFDAQHHYAE